jgi:hypothetical protein
MVLIVCDAARPERLCIGDVPQRSAEQSHGATNEKCEQAASGPKFPPVHPGMTFEKTTCNEKPPPINGPPAPLCSSVEA